LHKRHKCRVDFLFTPRTEHFNLLPNSARRVAHLLGGYATGGRIRVNQDGEAVGFGY